MDYLQKIVGDIELHSVEGIKECFSNGVNPNDYYKNEPLIFELTSEYTRTSRFKDCVKAFVEHGLNFNDKALQAVLLDDFDSLDAELNARPGIVEKRYTLAVLIRLCIK